jgi:hypothetical protein
VREFLLVFLDEHCFNFKKQYKRGFYNKIKNIYIGTKVILTMVSLTDSIKVVLFSVPFLTESELSSIYFFLFPNTT